MKLRHYTIISTLALLTASCAHEESEVAQISDIQLAITAAFATPAADFAAAGVGVGDESAAEKADSTANKTEKPAKSATKSTATAFESGDLLGLYAVKSGGELNAASNLINNHQLKVAESGAIVGDLLPAYYPDKSSSLDLFSYYPYQSGNATADALGVLVGIRTHQADFSSLQASDLCYGRKLDAAPSAAPHPLQFRHSFAQLRLNFSLYEGCSAISAVKLLAIKDSAKLNLQTGLVTLLPHTADVSPYVGSLSNAADATNPLQFTAIIPAQSLSGACVEITLTDGAIYYYHATAPIALKESATNTLNLTLSDKGKLTLASTPAITAWGAVSSSGSLGESASNVITLYWLAPHADYAKSDKVTLTITDPLGVVRDIDLTPTLNPTSSTAYAVLDLPLTLAGSYPLTISRVCIYNGATMLRDAPQETFVGKTISKAGAHTLGLNLAIEISPSGNWLNANYTKQEKTYTITTVGTTKWTASISGDAGAYINKTSGTTGQPLTITWSYNATATARSARVAIKTNPIGVETIINTTQNAGANQTITINGLKWATGNLVANGGQNCKIGAPLDGGLYFQFGSLLGWKGGATGDGTGVCTQTTNGKWFNNATSFNAANEIAVVPTVASATIAAISGTWPNQAGNNLYHFGYNTAPYSTAFTKLRDFAGFTAGTLADKGVGDPCRYYLSGTWRLPTAEEYKTMCSNYGGGNTPGSANAAWTTSPTAGMNFNNNGTKYFIPASGCRNRSDGALYTVGARGHYWSESVNNADYGYYLYFNSGYVYPQYNDNRRYGFPVRCVSN